MTQEKTKILVESFPNLYKHNMVFECADGWYNLLYDLSVQLEKIIVEYKKNNPDDSDWHPYASQVKEKYGTLRFYMSTYLDDFDDYINKAEDMSGETCEVCGDKGELFSRGHWYMTRCKEHRK